MSYFRFCAGDLGIYEAVEKDCPRNDPRRQDKPDGSWLPKAGPQYTGAISFWTPAGLEKYLGSGLQDWHRRVVQEPLRVSVATNIDPVLYQDEFQVICDPTAVSAVRNLAWEHWVCESGETVVDKVVAYVTRIKDGRSEILVFDHEKKWSDAGTQVPAGTVDTGESPENAVLREVHEESGLTDLRVLRKVDTYILYRSTHHQFQRRHVFELQTSGQLPDTWQHKVSGHGIDEGMNFHYYWLPFEQARSILVAGMGDSISKLTATDIPNRGLPVFQTERFEVKLAEASDAPAILRYFDQNRTNFAPTDPPKPENFYTEEFWANRVTKNGVEFKNEQSFRLFIFSNREPGRVIGSINFTQMARGPSQSCYLGYSLDREHQGQGIMFEALRLVIRHVFETMNFHRIMANHLPENQRSANLLKRLGFVVEGRAADYLFINGEWRDHILTSLTNSNWRRT